MDSSPDRGAKQRQQVGACWPWLLVQARTVTALQQERAGRLNEALARANEIAQLRDEARSLREQVMALTVRPPASSGLDGVAIKHGS